MGKKHKWLKRHEAEFLGLTPKPNEQKRKNARYFITKEQWEDVQRQRSNKNDVKVDNKTSPNDYKKESFVLNAFSDKGYMMNIDEYCKVYNLPKEDITSYKLVSHTGVPYYNIVFKENINENTLDFDKILSKYENFKPSKKRYSRSITTKDEFDFLTYTDVHIGMDTDSTGNSMYAEDWSEESIKKSFSKMIKNTIDKKSSDTIVVDELGDFLDGFNGYTTRGGHKLPQLMTNEEAFDVALTLKVELVDRLSSVYKKVIINNICNDNHSGAFSYFVNSSLKNLCDRTFDNVEVNNYRQFLNHYFINNIAFIITHGKDDSTLKFGFKPQLDSKGLEKIDHYCKQYGLYKKASKIVLKKGDSHQCLFDMCTSDDFYYFNYPALSPSSQWIQNNYKKGRRGYVLEKWNDLNVSIDPFFFT